MLATQLSGKLLVEAIGTFFLMLIIGLAVIPPGADVMAPIAIGIGLSVLIYAGGPISGAHYNPVVTIALLLLRRIEVLPALGYILAQLAGALLAAFTVGTLKPDFQAWLDAREALSTPALLTAEVLFTFALVWVILNVAVSRRSSGNNYFGFAIGGTVLTGAYAVGPISGAVFNPAVAAGLSLLGVVSLPQLALYVGATLAGAALAAGVFALTEPASLDAKA